MTLRYGLGHELPERPAEPWPNAGTTVPSRNFAVRPAPVDAAPAAASRPAARGGDANEPSATHNPLTSRRFSTLISLLFIRSLPPRQAFSVAKWFLYSSGARKAAAEWSVLLNGHA